MKTFKGTEKKVKEERNTDTEPLEPSGESNDTYRQGDKKNAEIHIFIYDNLLAKKKTLNFGDVKNIFLSN